jgi:hypothetical protein
MSRLTPPTRISPTDRIHIFNPESKTVLKPQVRFIAGLCVCEIESYLEEVGGADYLGIYREDGKV